MKKVIFAVKLHFIDKYIFTTIMLFDGGMRILIFAIYKYRILLLDTHLHVNT